MTGSCCVGLASMSKEKLSQAKERGVPHNTLDLASGFLLGVRHIDYLWIPIKTLSSTVVREKLRGGALNYKATHTNGSRGCIINSAMCRALSSLIRTLKLC
jgi:hypothetical protein